jgi:hypothetical protein
MEEGYGLEEGMLLRCYYYDISEGTWIGFKIILFNTDSNWKVLAGGLTLLLVDFSSSN